MDQETANHSINELVRQFMDSFSPGPNGQVDLGIIRQLFIPDGRIIKACSATPEIYSLDQFITPREVLLNSGTLTEFREEEIAERTEIFGNIACRWSVYRKTGKRESGWFTTLGRKSLHFVRTREGWRMSSLIWDDEPEKAGKAEEHPLPNPMPGF